MRMSDVEAAFPMLPLHPDVWPFFLFKVFPDPSSTEMSLFANLFGDFGAAGMPGTFKIFFVDVVVQMARSMRVLTFPMPIYVDDCFLIGPDTAEVDAEMEAFHEWAWDVCDQGDQGPLGGLAAASARLLVGLGDAHARARGQEARSVPGHVGDVRGEA